MYLQYTFQVTALYQCVQGMPWFLGTAYIKHNLSISSQRICGCNDPKAIGNEPTSVISGLRLLLIDDVARHVSFLASSDSNFVTGQTQIIDGGIIFT